jgi:DNA-binding response OmpR family regulator
VRSEGAVPSLPRRALLVETEPAARQLLRTHLELAGFQLEEVADGRTALERLRNVPYDLVILDALVPNLDAVTLCRAARAAGPNADAGIVMLSARNTESERVLGLSSGADDYVIKPFGIRELLARVHALLRRVELFREAGNDAAPPVLSSGELQVDLAQHVVTVEGAAIELTPKEFDLLALLVRNPGRAFARDYLLEKVWGYDYGGFDRTVDTHVLRLRKKLGSMGDRIETVWGVGYRLTAKARG